MYKGIGSSTSNVGESEDISSKRIERVGNEKRNEMGDDGLVVNG
jgi:hypothetical protein